MTIEEIADLRKKLESAQPEIFDTDVGLVTIRMHEYREEVRRMYSFMKSLGYSLVSVIQVEHRMCSGSGRLYYFVEETSK